tara:strand:- start:1222 stop:2511 length:1290 start_codon:yes stop_codon:yes gene_type:complete
VKTYPKTLQEWLDWQQTLHPQNIDFKLERIKSVYNKLNIKNIADKVIIIAGTNGKGSTVAILESILHESNHSVGSFTSPHIISYNERIRFNKKEAETSELIDTFKIIDDIRGNTTLTYFEFATLTAFYLFSKKKLDYAILEVGLGGRLDATNIIDSDLSIITSIGIDHTEFLGTTIDSIAMEKAGVMRPFKPCIYAGKNPPSAIFRYANKIKSRLTFNQNDFKVKRNKESWIWSNSSKSLKLPILPLVGDFQYDHAGAAISAINVLEPDILKDQICMDNAMKNISLLGRYQILSQRPEIILDVAHNEDSAQKLQENLKQNPNQNTIAIIGILKDKDVYSLIKPMINIVDTWYCVTIDNSRGMNAKEIKTRMSTLVSKDKIFTFDNIADASSMAMSNLDIDHRLIIYGSFYMVSDYLAYYESKNNNQLAN